ncbi:uncharacterized protein LOC116166881 [Photinus pyralis]|uniref:uncharacterized protein LOC116166881 n=1 Tax=Photinus pyralis TaxID=7054 RepID=UPI0012671E07|nr:uncharacterized protein LOC116166881 [Photinus pyralis]
MFFLAILFHGVTICAGHIVRDYIRPTGVKPADSPPFAFNGALLIFAVPFILITTLCIFAILGLTLPYQKIYYVDTNNNVHVQIENMEEGRDVLVVPLRDLIRDNKNME